MSKQRPPSIGELRQSQIVTTFGPGAMLDLPNYSVLIGGLESWRGRGKAIHEERLVGWLQHKLGTPDLRLYAPPVDGDHAYGKPTGISAIQFPTWFLGLVDQTHTEPDGRVYRTRPLVRYTQLQGGKYLTSEKKRVNVVPVRFVQACVRGHISDIDWYAFVRRDYNALQKGQLWFDEGGAGNDFAEIFVRCETTGLRRALSDATVPGAKALGRCRGRQPWLGPHMHESCDKDNRLLTRSASNGYFAQTMRVIAIPDSDQALRDAVSKVYDPFLMVCEDADDIQRERRKPMVQAAIEGFTNEAIWEEVQRRNQGIEAPDKGIKEAEIVTLLAQKDTLGEDKPEGDFYARNHPIKGLPAAAVGKVERLVLVHRLREVIAQVGFTRFDAAFPGINGELDLEVEMAPLAREAQWLPATENRGEGIFLAFNPDAIDAWLQREGVRARGEQLREGFDVWREQKGSKADFSGLPYIMLHSLSHLLITTLALDCGYSASSIRERIYVGDQGYGILLYTGSPGAEGTLGGLVDIGRDIGRHLERALELGRLCSNDPICAEHDPVSALEERYLHGAACHGCLLIAETSCERRNELLDRALVVPTTATADAAFFAEDL